MLSVDILFVKISGACYANIDTRQVGNHKKNSNILYQAKLPSTFAK